VDADVSLAETLLRELGVSAPAEGLAELQLVLADALVEAHARWPKVSLPPDRFLAHLAKHLGSREVPKPDALRSLHLSDLYLTCGCTLRDEAALTTFHTYFQNEISEAVAQFHDEGLDDDVHQLLGKKLLVGEEGKPAKVADYSGRGPLANWVRAAAVRVALRVSQKHGREVPLEDHALAHLPAPDPAQNQELAFVKAHYRDDFKQAFRDALAALSEQDRSVLKFHFLDGLNIDQIGAIYGVHRSTAARWIARGREKVFNETQRLVKERLRLDSGEFQSLMEDIRSGLDLSLKTYLR
jgi:RNA polymerase sigma-70 factor (ECF subfamily)